MFLTQDQIIALTGKQQPSAQQRALNGMGIVHKLRPDGSVVVLERHVQQELGGADQNISKLISKSPKASEPNWGAV